MENKQINTHQQTNTHFISALEELTGIKDTVVLQKIQTYKRNARWARLSFRVSGMLIIGLSVCLPFLTTLKGIWLSVILPIVGLVIAGLTGLNSFFRWENSWKGFSQTRYMLEHHLNIWDLKIIEAKYEENAHKSIEIAIQTTNQLLEDINATTSAEAEEYFKRVQLPLPRTPQS